MPTVIVSGPLANKPFNGGNAWVILNWILGLRRLDFAVYFLEELRSKACHGPDRDPGQGASRSFFRQVMEAHDLGRYSALLDDAGDTIEGMRREEVRDLVGSADLLVNISGHLALDRWSCGPRRRIFVDLDPGYTQFWRAQGLHGTRLDGHDAFFTIGENIGRPGCAIPTVGIPWQPTRQPIVLDRCPVLPATEPHRFTTVASWRGAYGPIEFGGTRYGQKAHEFRKIVALPRHVGATFEIALQIDPGDAGDRDLLLRHGWQLADPRVVAAPDAFQRYIQGSGAELSVAQGIYVATRGGWFSDRTVHYLACGRPALVQDTGFTRNYPVGEGLLAFGTLAEAVSGAQAIAADHDAHCQAARALAEAHFDSDRVLGRLIEDSGL